MKITLLILEILAIFFIGFLFFSNRYDKQIITVALNVICIGIAFTLLSLALSSSTIQFSLNRVLGINTAMFFIAFLAFVLAFFVNLENEEESNSFYIYFIYDRDKNMLVNIEKENNHAWLRMASYFSSLLPKDDSGNSIRPDANFFKDFLDFLIIRNLGDRYRSSWFIRFETLPLTGISSWGPKDHNLLARSMEIKQEDILGYKQNSLIHKVAVSRGDEVIKVPKDTSISLKRGVKTDLLPKMDLDKEMKSRTKRIIIKNKNCTISLDTYLRGVLTGDFLRDIKDEIVIPGLDKCKIQVFVFKAKYRIEYDRFRMGTKNLVGYYRPWAKDLCTNFQDIFDIQKKLKNITEDDRLRIRGTKL